MIFLASRLFLFGLILWSRMTVHRGKFWQPDGLLNVLLQYDGLRYVRIVQKGYEATGQELPPLDLFPVYPMLVRFVSMLVPSPEIAALLTSNLILLGAGLLLNEMVKLQFADPRVRRRTVLFLMFSPASFLLSGGYAESTFLFLSIATLLAASQGRWLLGCLLGMAVAATLPLGVLIVVPLLLTQVLALPAGGNVRARFHPRILLLALVPCGLGLYLWSSYPRSHDPFAPLRAAFHCFPPFTSAANALAYARDYDPRVDSLYLGFIAAATVLVLTAIWLKMRFAYVAYAAVLIAAVVCLLPLDASPRHLLIAFPLFMILGLLATRFEYLFEGLLGLSVGLLTFWTILFANGQYVI
ncbi:MAG: mannosyltransferase family protein [Chthoniobacterales bacterium]